jgi:uncharacterized caspase-like protein
MVQYCEFKMDRGALGMGASMNQECRVATFDPKTGRQLKELKLETDKNAMFKTGNLSTMSPDGRFLIALTEETPSVGGMWKPSLPGFGRGGGGGNTIKQPYKIRFTDLDSGKRLWEAKAESDDPFNPPSFVFSPNSGVLAIVTLEKNKGVINFHETASGRKISSIEPGGGRINEMRFSSDEKYLALIYGADRAMTTGPVTRQTFQQVGKDADVVKVYDLSNGRQAFTLTHDTAVTGVTFSPTGQLIATLGQNRNQYLWDARTGEKIATLVNLESLHQYGTLYGSTEWLVVTPDGLFDGSPSAWQQIMWRFSEDTFDIGPVEIFFNELYHPGLLSDIFSDKRPKAPRTLQQIDRRQPKVQVFLSQTAAGEISSRTVNVRIEVNEAPADATHPKGSGARDVRLFRNGTMVKLWRGDVLNGQKQTSLEATLPIVAGENRITAYAFNQDNVKSPDAFLTLTGSKSLARKGIAYVIAFGVNEYANPQYNLKYAGADATAFAGEVKDQQIKLDKYERVEVVSLLDKAATKANLLAALKRLSGVETGPATAELAKLERAQPEDSVIIYFAGHGTARAARFYLVPHDLGYTGPRAGIDAAAVETILSHSVSDLELEAAVEGLDASGMLLVIDACNSGQALEAEEKRRGPMNSKGLAQLAYEKGMFILTAAQSYQAALEAAQLGHGYLTYALIEEGLKKGSADREAKDGQVSVSEWFDYAAERVPEMQEQNSATRLLLEEEAKAKDRNQIRSLQRPRAFYRRAAEVNPVIIARP